MADVRDPRIEGGIPKPLLLGHQFDVVVGNPPWLSYRQVEGGEYRSFVKGLVTRTYHLLFGKPELITQMELGTLFFLRAADLYLSSDGTITFVLPRSLFTADQHDAFRQGEGRPAGRPYAEDRVKLEEIWDLGEVRPLFTVPACVVRARREERQETSYPLACRVFRGTLPRREANLDEAQEALEVADVHLSLNRRGERTFWATTEGGVQPGASPYRDRFRNGASIFPRAFWFVEVNSSPSGFDPSLRRLETSERAQRYARDAYRGLVIKGQVEARFLYATLLSTDLLPFGHLPFRLVVLPIEPVGKGYTLLTAEEARGKGYLELARWLEMAQAEWERRRGEKAAESDILDRLDTYHGLTSQSPRISYRVLYPKSATHICACVVENTPLEFQIGGHTLEVRGIVAEHVTCYYGTNAQDEAYYLTAVLNAPLIDEWLKPMQSRGQWGARDIHKKVLELPIPQFDPRDSVHRRLAELGEECSGRVVGWLESGGPGQIQSIGRLRSMVREMLAEELRGIDERVRKMVGE